MSQARTEKFRMFSKMDPPRRRRLYPSSLTAEARSWRRLWQQGAFRSLSAAVARARDAASRGYQEGFAVRGDGDQPAHVAGGPQHDAAIVALSGPDRLARAGRLEDRTILGEADLSHRSAVEPAVERGANTEAQ
jgi:hypothetical protein